ncbi:MAG: CoA-binding protein [Spirochaetes bacterium]|nr:CoA-binding protein [Spirochaetota bacterium]
METFFNPSSVAVIGASNTFLNLAATICNLLKHNNYHGRVYAVNRKGEAVHGCPGYTSVLDIPDTVDLAVILLSAQHVPQIVRDCGEKGIKNIIIESAGFSEAGGDGHRLQAEMEGYLRHYGMRLLGPNCLGTLNTHNGFCCFYGFIPEKYGEGFVAPGTISYIIQSGGIGVLVLDSFTRDVCKVNKMVSIGNKSDIDEADLIEYFDSDNTEVIGMYLENVRNGSKLMDAAMKTRKPILAFKVGRTSEGSKAAMSHTAGMANNDVIFESACRQAGIIRLKSISELHSMPKIFTTMPLLRGNRIAVVTNSGAFGGIAADLLVEAGLEMAVLSEKTQAKLAKTGQLFNAKNPVDLGPAMAKQMFLDIFEILLSADEVDGLLPVPNVWQDVVLEAIIELVKMCRHYEKPAALYIPNAIEKILHIRSKYQIPVFESPEEATRALAVSHQQHNYLLKKERHAYERNNIKGNGKEAESAVGV